MVEIWAAGISRRFLHRRRFYSSRLYLQGKRGYEYAAVWIQRNPGQRKEAFEMSESKERRMVANTGYEVKHAIHIGDREVLLAENMDEPDGQFYMKAEYMANGMIGQYDRIIYSTNYLAVMEEFIGAIDQKVLALREEFEKADYQRKPITAAECYPHDYGEDLNGKVVAIKAEVLRPEYRRGDRQLVLVDSGNGARGNARGRAVYCYYLYDGRHTRFERHDIMGEVRILPDWAKERLAAIRTERETAQSSEPRAEPEVVAGYTITERVKVGQKLFVLGEAPDSRYVTWQHMEGRAGYDIGHYFENRGKALADLRKRADKERSGQSPDRAKQSRNEAR
jgi:hypothetical protein